MGCGAYALPSLHQISLQSLTNGLSTISDLKNVLFHLPYQQGNLRRSEVKNQIICKVQECLPEVKYVWFFVSVVAIIHDVEIDLWVVKMFS